MANMMPDPYLTTAEYCIT